MILVRHGQSEFNVHYARTRQDPGIRDPELTDIGRSQIETSARYIRDNHRIRPTRIVASPYTRTLQSADILAQVLDLPILVDRSIGEHAWFTCDIGTPVTALRGLWPQCDFTDLPEEWWPEKEEEHHIDARARNFRARMASDPIWPETLIVSHWGFIRALTGHRVPNAAVLSLDPTHPHPGGGEVVSLPDL